MAGRMGNDRISVRNLEVVQVDPENNLLLLRGAVPGARNGYVIVQRMTELEVLAGGGLDIEPAEKEQPEAERTAKGKPEAAEKKDGGKKAAPAAKEEPAREGSTEKESTAEAAPATEEKEAAEEKPGDEPEAEAAKAPQETDPSEKKDKKE